MKTLFGGYFLVDTSILAGPQGKNTNIQQVKNPFSPLPCLPSFSSSRLCVVNGNDFCVYARPCYLLASHLNSELDGHKSFCKEMLGTFMFVILNLSFAIMVI